MYDIHYNVLFMLKCKKSLKIPMGQSESANRKKDRQHNGYFRNALYTLSQNLRLHIKEMGKMIRSLSQLLLYNMII